ncbi:MAG: restriction endonuclease, partial [Phycisphaerae bacterium]
MPSGVESGTLRITMSNMIEQRRDALVRRIDQMREMDEWHLFQNFVLGLLPHDGYTGVRLSAVRNDFGRDAVAVTPKGGSCFVAVSFDCSLAKIRKDAKRWSEDPNREDAKVMVFITWDKVTEATLSKWRDAVKERHKLRLDVIHRETICATATREGVWRETCSR